MISEVLSKMIKKAEMGFISGFVVGKGEVPVFHIQFADTTMIFYDADVRQVDYLRCIFICLEEALGIGINLAKSEIFQVGEDCDIITRVWLGS